MNPVSRLTRALRRPAAPEPDPEEDEPLPGRPVEKARGVITAIRVRPRNGTPWLEAEFADDAGTIRLTWMGRREIPGICVGRELVVEGRVSHAGGQRHLYNPRYELLIPST